MKNNEDQLVYLLRVRSNGATTAINWGAIVQSCLFCLILAGGHVEACGLSIGVGSLSLETGCHMGSFRILY